MTEIMSREVGELRRLIESGKVTLAEVMDRLAPKAKADEAVASKLPKPVKLSDEHRKALRTLPARLAEVELPGSPRMLTQDERNVLVPLFENIKVAKDAVAKAEEAFKEAMHNDIDAKAPQGAERAKNGHFLTEGEVAADDHPTKVVRGLVGGKGMELTSVDLERLRDEGKITVTQFRRWTKKVTNVEVVPSAVLADMAKDAEVLAVIASVARRSDQTTAIRMAKA